MRLIIYPLTLHKHSFNPRTRVGCDNRLVKKTLGTNVSIHAPVWGATAHKSGFSSSLVFQSTHPCGVRLSIYPAINPLAPFQSTHPCGVRLFFVTFVVLIMVSIHAPVWGATLSLKISKSLSLFQSTHPCGVRLDSSNSARAQD